MVSEADCERAVDAATELASTASIETTSASRLCTALLTQVLLERIARGLEVGRDGERLDGVPALEGRERGQLLGDAGGEARVEDAMRRFRHRRGSRLVRAEEGVQHADARRCQIPLRLERLGGPSELEVLLDGRHVPGSDEQVGERLHMLRGTRLAA